MKKKFSIAALLMSLSVMLTGCSSTLRLSNHTQNLMKGIAIKAPEAVELTPEWKLCMRLFTVHLLQQMASDENVMISPLSVMTALAMVSVGAENKTAVQMEQMFGMELETLHPMLSTWLNALPNGAKTKVNLANSIWLRQGDSAIREAFLTENAKTYHASIYRAAFDASTVSDINHWVKHETNDMIPKILDGLSADIRLILINAIAFDGKWVDAFHSNETFDAPFTQSDGTIRQVSMMHGEAPVYLESDDAVGFRKPYCDGYSFVAVLPNAEQSIAEFIAGWTGERLTEWMDQAQYTTVHIGLPKFKSEYGIRLNHALQAMGMTDAFTDQADFSGICDDSICIDDVLHKTYIDVDENGTKAAAVTAVTMKTCALEPTESKTVILDRPFVYMIVEDTTNIPLFIGTVTSFDVHT